MKIKQFMTPAIKNYFWGIESRENAWGVTKIVFVIYWLYQIVKILLLPIQINFPKSVCLLINCTHFLIPISKSLLILFAIIASVLFVFEKFMVFTLGILSLISILVFSINTSIGYDNAINFSSAILISQLIAYILFKVDKEEKKLWLNRIHFPVQIIVASYFLAALSKIQHGGFSWFLQNEGFVIQVKKSLLQEYYTSGNLKILEKIDFLTSFFTAFPLLVNVLLLFAFLLEFFGFIILFKKEAKVIYGFLLLLMHLGIYYVMGIEYFPIHIFLFLINGPLLIMVLIRFVKNKLNPVSKNFIH
jgi:hypothetical protein